jgi:acylaminoacyl-peptidase
VRLLIRGRIGDGWHDVDRALRLPEGATLETLLAEADRCSIPLRQAIEQSPHLSDTLMLNGERCAVDANLDRPLADGDEVFLLAPVAGGGFGGSARRHAAPAGLVGSEDSHGSISHHSRCRRRCSMRQRQRVLVSILTLSLSSTSLTAAGDDPARLRLIDEFELETASDPQISPGGERIVYVRGGSDIMSDRRTSSLWIVGADGSEHRPLVTGRERHSAPRWSPSGDRLAYVAGQAEAAQIWVRYMDTGQSAKITHLQHAPSDPSWSPDGTRIAFLSLVEEEAPKIAEWPRPPEGAEWAEPPRVVERLFYRYDPVGYLPRGTWQLFVVPAEGGTARQVTHEAFSMGGPALRSDSGIEWTPDGRHLIVSAIRDVEREPLDSEVFEITVADGTLRPLTDRRGPDSSPALSPDGRRIAFTGYDDRAQGYQLTHLYVMNRDGSGRRQLAAKLGRSVATPRWSADGERVLFLYTSEGKTRLAAAALGGEVTDLVDDVGTGTSAYAGSGDYSVARDGRFAYTRATPQAPPDVALGGGSGGPRQLTAINEDLLGHKELAAIEEIWFDSSHDGRRVQGWILRPPGFDPQQKYPLVLEIHGGPFAAYGPKFDLEKQLMAAHGYVVLYTNPRGSTSYGEEFGNLIHHAYPGDDFFDLVSGVDAVIARGYVDPERLFVTGGSGGGVLTSWTIGRSDRFRAAVTIYPVINWTSWVLTADIPAFGVKYWFPGLPWDHVEHYQSRSLLSVVENVTTPTMVLTGEADYRTPMSESEQYFTALQLLGVESVLVRVPEESHGISGRPSHHMQKMAFILGWFEKHDRTGGPAAATGGH